MTNKDTDIVLTPNDALAVWHDNSSKYEKVAEQWIEEWRWGNRYYVIIQDITTCKLYGASIQVQTGDNYYVDWEDSAVRFEEVQKVERSIYEYLPV